MKESERGGFKRELKRRNGEESWQLFWAGCEVMIWVG
jgi:hypothetical protein